MRRTLLGILTILMASPAAVFGASDRSDSHNRLEAISPFIEEGTIAVAHVDLTRFDVSAAIEELADMIGLEGDDRDGFAKAQTRANRIVAALKNAGATHVYAMASLQDFARGWRPCILVPVKEGGDLHAVAAIMYSGDPKGPTNRNEAVDAGRHINLLDCDVCEPVGNVVLCGTERTVARLKKAKPTAQPGMNDAFDAAGDAAACLAFAPSADQRRVLTEMAPRLPEELGGGSGVLSNGLLWAVVVVQSSPNLSARLVIQSKDAESAERFERLLVGSRNMLSQMVHQWHKPLKPGGQMTPHEAFRKRTGMNATTFDEFLKLLTPHVEGNRLVLVLDERNQGFAKLARLLRLTVREASRPARRRRCGDNLKHLALAMCNFHDSYGSYPPPASYDTKGNKLLSWRVFLLPYLDQWSLYKQFHLDEPWDSEHNKRLIPKMPAVFACPNAGVRHEGKTTYLVPLGERTVFFGKTGMPAKEVSDGTSNTILLLDVDPNRAVIWTKPDDLEVDFNNVRRGLEGNHDGVFATAFCDGSVRWISPTIPPDTLRLLLMRNDGKAIEDY